MLMEYIYLVLLTNISTTSVGRDGEGTLRDREGTLHLLPDGLVAPKLSFSTLRPPHGKAKTTGARVRLRNPRLFAMHIFNHTMFASTPDSWHF
jgi:hypothetical protein